MFNKFVLGQLLTTMLYRMADEGEGGYGYGEDEDAKVSPYNFGLNAGNTRLVKFEWKPDAGKDGAEQEALEIVFNINGKDRSYRQFPVTRGFDKNNQPVTDPKAPEFIEARKEFESRITHIMHCFVADPVLKQALSKRFPNFKEYCNVLKGLLPKNTPEIPLDIFMQYQFTLKGDAKRTYLDIPTKRKHGKWLCKAVAPVGKWTMVKATNPEDNVQDAIKYVDDAGNVHPFIRTGWFANSYFARQQRADGSSETSSSNTAESGAAMNAGTTGGGTPPATTPSTW
jgi:hypothetical protein